MLFAEDIELKEAKQVFHYWLFSYFQHKISQEDILRKRKPELTSEIVYEVASQAHMHLEKVNAGSKFLLHESFLIVCDFICKQ